MIELNEYQNNQQSLPISKPEREHQFNKSQADALRPNCIKDEGADFINNMSKEKGEGGERLFKNLFACLLSGIM